MEMFAVVTTPIAPLMEARSAEKTWQIKSKIVKCTIQYVPVMWKRQRRKLLFFMEAEAVNVKWMEAAAEAEAEAEAVEKYWKRKRKR